MATVIIDEEHTVYADVEDADAYLDGASHADAWRAITDDDVKARYLVTSTRTLDRQRWKPEYDTFAEREFVQDIIDASIELALAILNGDDVQNSTSTAQKVKRLQAGSVSIENFAGTSASTTRFPTIVQELLRDYLLGAGSAVSGPVATGTDTLTSFPIDLGYTGGL